MIQEKNPYILKGLVNHRSLPEEEDEDSVDEDDEDYENYDFEAEEKRAHLSDQYETARWAYEYYSCAYNQSGYRHVLDEFISFGTVFRGLDGPSKMSMIRLMPPSGWVQTAHDVDPASGCSLWSLFCVECGRYSTRHFCNLTQDQYDALLAKHPSS